jgi:exopolysaccharide biosynthesis predicted pyruvyltransferase EpsI
MTTGHIAIIDRQVAALEALYTHHAPPGTDYALLDFPSHPNVGDSAIWSGEIALLQRTAQKAPAYVCDLANFDAEALRQACPQGPIFLHGGGNFGDIWPEHQAFREHVIASFPDREIVQLPQSIMFSSHEAIQRCAECINAHQRFTLYVRDEESAAFAQEHFSCPVITAPDSAFGLGPLFMRQTPRWRILALLRTDLEKNRYFLDDLRREPGMHIADWLDEESMADRTYLAMAKLKSRIKGSLPGTNMRLARYNALATARVERGLRLLTSGDVLICDRLHAHILAVLLNIRHVTLDNTYGKIARYGSRWTFDFQHVWRANTLAEALDTARDVLGDGAKQPARSTFLPRTNTRMRQNFNEAAE